MRKLMKFFLFVSSLILFFLFFNCSQKLSPVESGIQTGTLHFGNQTEPQDLDPHITTGVPEFHILGSIFEGLVNLDPKDLSPLPGAARSWEVSDDGLTYTFHLRNGARWSNGDPLKASDFVFSFQRILSPALGAEYAYMLYSIKNARDFHTSQISDFSLVGAKASDDSTLVIELDKPTPYFLSLTAHHSFFPVNPSIILKHGKIDTRGTPWTRPSNLVGNGPFKLTSWEINKIVSVEKNPLYWDSSRVSLNTIHFYPIENNMTEERAFRTGQLHITANLPPQKISWYRENRPEVLRIDPYLGTYYYLVNVNRKPLDNVNVRRALSLAIDRKAITENLLKGGQNPATCFTPPEAGGGYRCDSMVMFDTTEAKRLLAEAGYGPGNPLPLISLLYNTSETHHMTAQAIQQMWKKYLGIDVTLVNQEWKVYLSSTHGKNYDIARMGWVGDYDDPNSFLDMWITDGGNNRTGWSNAAYDSLIELASRTADKDSRFAFFREAEKILLSELPVIPLYFYTNVYLLHPSVKGWDPNLLNIHNLKFISLK
jgi:oligopeptide transport system substrate-binding protein